MCRPIILGVGLSIVGMNGCWAAGADCARAQSPVERAICSKTELKAADERLAKAYALRFSHVLSSPRHELAQKQKAWLLRRDSDCGAKPEGMADCIARMTGDRLSELQESSDAYRARGSIVLGTRTFEFGPTSKGDGVEAVSEKGHVVAEANEGFMAWQGLVVANVVRDGGSVLVELSAKDCSTHWCAAANVSDFPVVLHYPMAGGGAAKAVAFEPGMALTHVPGGYDAEREATPSDDGVARSWRIATGFSPMRTIEWTPSGGSASGLYADTAEKEAVTPWGGGIATNRHFYDTAVKTLGVDRRELLRAFNEDAAHRDLKGGGNDSTYHGVIGCWRAAGSFHPDRGDGAAIVAPDGSFVLVLDAPIEGGSGHDVKPARYYPAWDAWPASFKVAYNAFLEMIDGDDGTEGIRQCEAETW